MAKKNEVTLTFAGDHDKLTKSFEAVGSSARGMSDDVGKSSRDIGEGIDVTGNKAGDLESGFRGITDSMSGFSQIAQGDVLGGLTDLSGGVEALATGFSGVLVPALKRGFNWLGNTRVGMLASAAATKTMTVAQKALNLAMRMNPIGIVITVLAALVAGIVLAYKKSSTFRNVVQAAFRGVQAAGRAMWNFLKGMFNFIIRIPGRVRSAFRSVGNAISAPFRAGFNAVRSAWNNTVGGKGFDIPSWVPGLGGKSFRIPYFHRGGIVPGAPGQESLAVLEAGERVTPANRSGETIVIELRSSGTRLDDLLLEVLRNSIRVKGGNVQVVLGS